MDQSPHWVPAAEEQLSPHAYAVSHPIIFLSCPQDLNALTHLFSHDCGFPLVSQLAPHIHPPSKLSDVLVGVQLSLPAPGG